MFICNGEISNELWWYVGYQKVGNYKYWCCVVSFLSIFFWCCFVSFVVVFFGTGYFSPLIWSCMNFSKSPQESRKNGIWRKCTMAGKSVESSTKHKIQRSGAKNKLKNVTTLSKKSPNCPNLEPDHEQNMSKCVQKCQKMSKMSKNVQNRPKAS